MRAAEGGWVILSWRPLSPNHPPPACQPACNCPDALIVFAYYTRPFMSYGNMKFIVSSSVLQPRSSLSLNLSQRPSVLQRVSLDSSAGWLRGFAGLGPKSESDREQDIDFNPSRKSPAIRFTSSSSSSITKAEAKAGEHIFN